MPLSGPRPPRQGEEAERAEYLRAQLREARRKRAPVTPERKLREQEVKEEPGADGSVPSESPALGAEPWQDDRWRADEWDAQWDQWGQWQDWGASCWGDDDDADPWWWTAESTWGPSWEQ
eukprot:7265124-Alexandrium_andersonii.AAC.1